jgi:hypothetical protein
VRTASRAAGPKSQYWAEAQNGEGVHDATSTVNPAPPDRAGEVIVSAKPRADTSSSLLDYYSTCCATSRALPLMDQRSGAGQPGPATPQPTTV